MLSGLAGIFRCSGHRLGRMMICQLAVLATDPRQLLGTFLGLAYELLNCSFESVLETAGGHVNLNSIRTTIGPDGVIDALRFLLSID